LSTGELTDADLDHVAGGTAADVGKGLFRLIEVAIVDAVKDQGKPKSEGKIL
jgi:hypothetical protein